MVGCSVTRQGQWFMVATLIDAGTTMGDLAHVIIRELHDLPDDRHPYAGNNYMDQALTGTPPVLSTELLLRKDRKRGPEDTHIIG